MCVCVEEGGRGGEDHEIEADAIARRLLLSLTPLIHFTFDS